MATLARLAGLRTAGKPASGLVEGDVADLVGAVLDPPVAAVEGKYLGRFGILPSSRSCPVPSVPIATSTVTWDYGTGRVELEQTLFEPGAIV